MDSDQAAIFIIISIAFAFFIWGRWRYDLVAMMALLTSVIAGVVPWSQAFSGFAHPAVITVAAVLIISRCFTIRPNVPYIKVSLPTNSSIGGTDGASG